MVYDEEDRKRSRVVIETPSARREEVRTVTARGERRRGIHPGTVAALVIGSVALVTVLFLLVLNRQPPEDTRVTTTSTTDPTLSQPVVVQPTPLAQPPIIIQQPGSVTTQPPIIIEQPAPAAVPPSAASAGADDSRIQSEIDKRMAEDSVLSTAAVIATVVDGKVTLIGTVDSATIKNRVEGLVRALRGVKAVDSQIIVSAG